MTGDVGAGTMTTGAHRWDDYVIGRADRRYGYTLNELVVGAVWPKRPSLFVTGLGYDPRAITGLEAAAPFLPEHTRVVGIVPSASSGTSRGARLQSANQDRARELAGQYKFGFEVLSPDPDLGDPRWAGIGLARRMQGMGLWSTDHVIIDGSAMPSPILFALTKAWLQSGNPDMQLQLIITESAELDDRIQDEGVRTPIILPGFDYDRDINALGEGNAKVWIPVLGHEKLAQLQAIADLFKPDEICPVLPFPSADPRRGDRLVVEYEQFLFQQTTQVDPRNFIHADAGNPFDVYRRIIRLNRRYTAALAPLEDVHVMPSVHGSKLLGVGVLLASIDAGLSVINAGPDHSRLDASDDELDGLRDTFQPTCLWLAGSPYAAVDSKLATPLDERSFD